jgi:hypothetical protein
VNDLPPERATSESALPYEGKTRGFWAAKKKRPRETFTGFGLGHEGEVARWTGLFQRAATRLLRAHDEHRVHGQYAFRGQEDVTATYPSLYALLRSAPSRRAPAGEPVDEGASDDDETPVAPV